MMLRSWTTFIMTTGLAGASHAAVIPPTVTIQQIGSPFGFYARATAPGVSIFENFWGTFSVRLNATGVGGSILEFTNIEQVLAGTLTNAELTEAQASADVAGLSLLLRDRTTKVALLTIEITQGELALTRPVIPGPWTGSLIDGGSATVRVTPGPLMQGMLPAGVLIGKQASIAVSRLNAGLQNDALTFFRGDALFSASARLDFSCQADLNDDGFVDDTDFVLFTQNYQALDCDGRFCRADLDEDGDVDDADFVLFSQAYDQFACPDL